MLASVAATNETYTESALSFMLPVEPTDLAPLKNRRPKWIYVIAPRGRKTRLAPLIVTELSPASRPGRD